MQSEAAIAVHEKRESLPALSLHRIETELMQLLEAREQAEADGELPENLKVFDVEIQRYVDAEIRKVDGVARAIRAAYSFAEEARFERERLEAREKAWTARAERIKAAALYAMQAAGVKVIETATNKLRLQKNGGLQPLEIDDEESLPVQFRVATVTMSLRLLRSICRDLTEAQSREIAKTVTSADTGALRAALSQREMCPAHDGMGCEVCGGLGVLPKKIPGARLLDRGVHLRVE